MEKYDIIIIGAGPAGLTAGLYAGRQGKKTLVIDKNISGGAGRQVPAMENYPGFELIAGVSLIEKMKDQCVKNSDLHEFETIKSIEKIEDDNYNFKIITNKEDYNTKALILATGSTFRHLNVEGEKEFLGKGVAYCATCDGMFFKGKKVAMVGGGNSALQEAIYLYNIGCDVTIIHRRDKFRGDAFLQQKIKDKGINVIYNSNVKKIEGKNVVESITIVDNENNETKLNLSAVFIAIGSVPQTELAESLDVELDEDNYIKTDKSQRTNLRNVYASGDITGGVKQWVVACSEGAIAALSAYDDLER
ncbi:NAD(P)/FAD-dependent oxidoreductase [Methanobrevibacter sp. DSM 116169]|uniref:NAD(P)/FAD-dependent oxidoreductase n=1 Tax=Methanobrevibacter sp. DSM 116169 TaxID=3242727 RepID=UPI0038FC09BB